MRSVRLRRSARLCLLLSFFFYFLDIFLVFLFIRYSALRWFCQSVTSTPHLGLASCFFFPCPLHPKTKKDKKTREKTHEWGEKNSEEEKKNTRPNQEIEERFGKSSVNLRLGLATINLQVATITSFLLAFLCFFFFSVPLSIRGRAKK